MWIGRRKSILLSVNDSFIVAYILDLMVIFASSSSVFILSTNIIRKIPLRKMAPEKILIRRITLSGSAIFFDVPFVIFSILLGQSYPPQCLSMFIVPLVTADLYPPMAIQFNYSIQLFNSSIQFNYSIMLTIIIIQKLQKLDN